MNFPESMMYDHIWIERQKYMDAEEHCYLTGMFDYKTKQESNNAIEKYNSVQVPTSEELPTKDETKEGQMQYVPKSVMSRHKEDENMIETRVRNGDQTYNINKLSDKVEKRKTKIVTVKGQREQQKENLQQPLKNEKCDENDIEESMYQGDDPSELRSITDYLNEILLKKKSIITELEDRIVQLKNEAKLMRTQMEDDQKRNEINDENTYEQLKRKEKILIEKVKTTEKYIIEKKKHVDSTMKSIHSLKVENKKEDTVYLAVHKNDRAALRSIITRQNIDCPTR